MNSKWFKALWNQLILFVLLRVFIVDGGGGF